MILVCDVRDETVSRCSEQARLSDRRVAQVVQLSVVSCQLSVFSCPSYQIVKLRVRPTASLRVYSLLSDMSILPLTLSTRLSPLDSFRYSLHDKRLLSGCLPALR